MTIVWPSPIKRKLRSYQSNYFTPDETYQYISNLINKTEATLQNEIISFRYTEEYGAYKNASRIVIDKFKIYYIAIGDIIVIAGIKFPREY